MYLNIFTYHSLDNKINMELPENLKISTMTATSQIYTNKEVLDISKIYENLSINNNIVYIEWANNTPKGLSPKQESHKKKKNKKVFFNQITIVIVVENDYNNIKLFNNGAISMTGVKSPKNGQRAVNILVENINKIKDLLSFESKMEHFNVVWINSDYKSNFEIKRSELHQLLVNKYNIFSSFEPCIYPGVMSKFFWNVDYKNKPDKLLGKCYCSNLCSGKGNGSGNGNCKKITISVFQSGSVIIGAQTFEQIIDGYNFIKGVFVKHNKELKKINAPFLELEKNNSIVSKKKEKTIYYIRRSNIVYE